VASFLDRVRHDPNVVAVVAVGSAIRPDVTSEDLDLIVLCGDRRTFKERAPIEVDLRSFDVADVDDGIRRGQDLLSWTVRFGEPLFDRGHAWERTVDEWKDRLPLPDPKVARARASTALAQAQSMSAAGDEDASLEVHISYLTHLARALLAEAGVYPASRPELPNQLRQVGEGETADQLAEALRERAERRAMHTAG
jgi:predicted nucleotidyltransferase